jgi:hypothetical protein
MEGLFYAPKKKYNPFVIFVLPLHKGLQTENSHTLKHEYKTPYYIKMHQLQNKCKFDTSNMVLSHFIRT